MTATMLARRMTAALVAVVNLVFLVACGGSDGGPVSPVVVTPPPTPVLTSFLVTVDSVITEGGASPVRFFCAYDGGASYDCTAEVQSWSAESPLEKRGTTVVGMTVGVGKISASFKGKIAEVSVRVKPDGTPWDSLPVQTTEEQRKFISSTLVGGRVTPWGKKSPTVWVNPGLSSTWKADFDSASSYWKDMTDGQVSLVLVADSAQADITVSFNPSLDSLVASTGACGEARWSVSNGYLVKGVINFSTIASCRNWFFIQLAHDFGHVLLGTRSHTPGCGDVLGSPCAPWQKSEFLRGVSKFVYLVPHGTKPI